MTKDGADLMLRQWSSERPDLDSTGLGVVVRVMSLYRIFVRQAATALQETGLELWEYDVLSALRRQGAPHALPASELAAQTELSTGAMTNRINQLEARGLVKRARTPADRRSVIVSLTRKGVTQIDAATGIRVSVAKKSLESLLASEQRQLNRMLRTLILDNEE